MHARHVNARSASSYRTWVQDRAPTLLRLAHQMLGNPHAAVDAVCDALSRRGLSTRATAASDETVLRDLTGAVLGQQVPDGMRPSLLDDLSPRERVATVLAFGQGWDPEGVAGAMGTTPTRARAQVRRALSRRDEAAWRTALADPSWAVDTPANLADRCAARARLRRGRRRRRLLAGGAAVVAVTGAAVAVWRIANAPPPPPPTAHVAGLLPWPPRGDLVRDRHLFDAAIGVWRRGSTTPLADPFVLYAGHVGVGRLVVLQALTRGGIAELAIVGDHDVSFGHARLHLDLVAPLPVTDVPVLVVPYNGNLNLPGLTPGPGSRVVQLLVAPGIDRVEQRHVIEMQYPPADWLTFTQQNLAGGLSEPWLDLSGDRPATVVRAFSDRRVVFTGLLSAEGIQPARVRPRIVAAPGAWPARQAPVDPDAVSNDTVWWAQLCRRADPLVQPAWATSSSLLAAPVRLELLRCTSDSEVHAEFVMGAGGSQRWVADISGSADAYVARFDVGVVAVVASAKARRIAIGSQVTLGRVAVGFGLGSQVRVFDAAGHLLTVR